MNATANRHQGRKLLVAVRIVLLTIFVSWLPGCSREPPVYYPLTPDLTWHYYYSTVTAEGASQTGYTITNRTPIRWGGHTVHVRRLPDGTRWFYLDTNDGIFRIASQRPGDPEPAPLAADSRTVLVYPLRRGQSWFTNTETLILGQTSTGAKGLRTIVPVTLKHTIKSLDESIKVPAGTFHDCLQVRARGESRTRDHATLGEGVVVIELTEWYAPGVGLVKSLRRETVADADVPDGEIRFELASFSHR